jgi:hypothetical protein
MKVIGENKENEILNHLNNHESHHTIAKECSVGRRTVDNVSDKHNWDDKLVGRRP